MDLKNEFAALVESLKKERDEIQLRLHLTSMEVQDEFESFEYKWDALVKSCAELADEAKGMSDEALSKSKLVAEEVKESYQRIRSILHD